MKKLLCEHRYEDSSVCYQLKDNYVHQDETSPNYHMFTLDVHAEEHVRKDPLVHHPPHYKAWNGVEAIDVVEGFELNFRLGNAVTYILRHKRKGGLQDLKKAAWYLAREIDRYEGDAV